MYTLRFPFKTPPDHVISEDVSTITFDHLAATLGRDDDFCVLEIVGFASEEEAENFLPRIWCGLASLLLNQKLPVSGDFVPQKVYEADDPVKAAENLSKSFGGADFGDEVHGLIDGTQPAIYPTTGSYRRLTAGSVSVLKTVASTNAASALEAGMVVKHPVALLEDQKLQTALELYGAYFTESSARAKFISLVMVLEALAESTPRPQVILDFLNTVNEMAQAHRRDVDENSNEASAFDALQREIIFRRKDSIRSQIRRIVLDTLSGKSDVDDLASQAVQVYDKRSTLVHKEPFQSRSWQSQCLPPKQSSSASSRHGLDPWWAKVNRNEPVSSRLIVRIACEGSTSNFAAARLAYCKIFLDSGA